MSRYLICLSLGLCFLVSGVARAQSSDADAAKERAAILMDKLRFQEAYEVLAEIPAAVKTDPSYGFMYGVAALQSGHTDQAIAAFESLLKANPDLPRVRLELARAYRAKGRSSEAREQFTKVLEASPPEAIRTNVEKYLRAMEEAKPWRLQLSLGYMYDTNANAGPTSDTINLNTQLGPVAFPVDQKHGDSAIVSSLAFDHTLVVDRSDVLALRSNIGINTVSYFEQSQSNLEEIAGGVGPAFRWEKFIFALPVVADYSHIESERYACLYGVAPDARWLLADDLTLNASFQLQRAEYYTRRDRYGHRWIAAASLHKSFDLKKANTYIDIGVRHGREDTQVTYLDNDSDAIYVTLSKDLTSCTWAWIRPSVSNARYDDVDPFYAQTSDRMDWVYSLDVGWSVRLGKSPFTFSLGYGINRADSNLEAYDYWRQQFSAQFVATF